MCWAGSGRGRRIAPRGVASGRGEPVAGAVWLGLRRACPSRSFDGDDFDDVEEDEGLEDLENAEEVGAPRAAAPACPARLCHYLRPARWPG